MKVHKNTVYLSLAALILAVAAFLGYRIWNEFVLASLHVQLPHFAIGLAFLAGLISFFAPCGIALLPAFLSYNAVAVGEGIRPAQLAKIGMLAAAGMASFFVFIGALFSLLGRAINSYLVPVQYGIAILLVVFGLLLFRNVTVVAGFFEEVRKSTHTQAMNREGFFGFYIFGFAYGLDAIGCLFPLILALVLIPLAAGSILVGVSAFLAYSLGIALMLTIFVYAVSEGKERIVRTTDHARTIQKAAGIGLMLGGVFLFSYYIYFGMVLRGGYG